MRGTLSAQPSESPVEEAVGVLAVQQVHATDDEDRSEDPGQRIADRRGRWPVGAEQAGGDMDHRDQPTAGQDGPRPAIALAHQDQKRHHDRRQHDHGHHGQHDHQRPLVIRRTGDGIDQVPGDQQRQRDGPQPEPGVDILRARVGPRPLLGHGVGHASQPATSAAQ
ncbi:hypothetical protein MSMEG_0955 [Mycolicibacterium smegmatis MC2 155]|uniref:Uncharacterized protein n=1 Tax=Mycolicibacterium smegmatis (strain ATCC 700084 / mc(2)155) TaxID=246196 RepID=A0QR21_MYCS2|nr:hypothetical protein MSMEG_0955 [Mycolicibacterium smegmatis MC2 155]